MRHAAFLPVLLLAAVCPPVLAQPLKPGLWEISNRVKGSPEMDQAMAQMQQQLAAMPPEQRKQMEAMLAQRGMRMAPAAGEGLRVQLCMTREMAERREVPVQDGCKVTKHERSGKTLKMAFSCSNGSSGEGEFTFASDQAYSSQMLVRTAVQGRAETTRMEASGRWLAADCGAVRPAK